MYNILKHQLFLSLTWVLCHHAAKGYQNDMYNIDYPFEAYGVNFVSGLGTASVYCDRSLRRNGFPFECHRNFSEVLAVKSHRANLNKFSRAILVIRNPTHTLLAFFNYRNAGHVGTAAVSLCNEGKYLYISITRTLLESCLMAIKLTFFNRLSSYFSTIIGSKLYEENLLLAKWGIHWIHAFCISYRPLNNY